jgi:hypothetical protein
MTDIPDAAVQIATEALCRAPHGHKADARDAVAALAREYEFCPPGTQSRLAALEGEISSSRAAMGTARDERDDAERRLVIVTRKHDEGRVRISELEAEIERLRTELAAAEELGESGYPYHGPLTEPAQLTTITIGGKGHGRQTFRQRPDPAADDPGRA